MLLFFHSVFNLPSIGLNVHVSILLFYAICDSLNPKCKTVNIYLKGILPRTKSTSGNEVAAYDSFYLCRRIFDSVSDPFHPHLLCRMADREI